MVPHTLTHLFSTSFSDTPQPVTSTRSHQWPKQESWSRPPQLLQGDACWAGFLPPFVCTFNATAWDRPSLSSQRHPQAQPSSGPSLPRSPGLQLLREAVFPLKKKKKTLNFHRHTELVPGRHVRPPPPPCSRPHSPNRLPSSCDSGAGRFQSSRLPVSSYVSGSPGLRLWTSPPSVSRI